MWYLKSNTGQLIYLKINRELIVGRKKGDIICQDDKSISRLHACISVEAKQVIEVGKPTSMCKLKDLDTKYGTFVFKGDLMIDVKGNEYILEDQDKIRFGLQECIYTIIYLPIVTVISSLSQDDSKKLQSLMEEIDGAITNEWISSCTHLTVSKATLTEKVVCAMASAVPIVDINYWEHVKLAFDNGEKMPDPNDFVLELVESLVSKGIKLDVNEKRKTLFKNFIFVYFNMRQCKQYEKMIRLAGGQLVLYTKRPLSEKQLRAANVIVVQYSGNDETQSTQSLVPEYETIYKTLQAHNRRMISDSEIPVAILQCSMNTHCNPKFKFGELFKRSEAKHYSSAVLAPDTHDMLCNAGARPKIISDVPVKMNVIRKISNPKAKIIPETCDSFSNIDSLSNFSIDSQTKAPSTIRADYISETIDSLSCPTLDSQKYQHTVKMLNSPDNSSDYIPETIDSLNRTTLDNQKYQHTVKMLNPPNSSCNYIPETIDSLTRTTLDNQKYQHTVKMLNPPNSSCNYIPETIDSLTRTTLDNQKYQHTVKMLNPPNSSCNYIPETIDSDCEPDPVVQKVTEISLNDTRNLKQQLMKEVAERAESSNRIIPDTISQSSDRIELDTEKYLQSQRQKNSVKADNSKQVVTLERSKILSKVPDVIEIDMDDDDDTSQPPMKPKLKANHMKISNIGPQTPAMDNQKLKTTNRNNDWNERNDNVQFSKSTRKETSSEETIVRESLPSAIVTSTPRKANSNRDTSKNASNRDTSKNASNRDTAENSSNCDTSGKPRSSLLRTTVGYKRFQKVYKMIPAKRITLADMYVWNENYVRQV